MHYIGEKVKPHFQLPEGERKTCSTDATRESKKERICSLKLNSNSGSGSEVSYKVNVSHGHTAM